MKVLLAHMILLITSITLTAQTITWQRTYGDGNLEYGYSIVQTSDEGYIAVGRKRMNSENYILVIKLNNFGDTTWTKILDGFSASYIQTVSDGNFVICGSSLIKIDVHGNVIWNRPQEWPYPKKFVQLSDNGFFLISNLESGFYYYPLLIRLDSTGNRLWSHAFSEDIVDGRFTDFILNDEGSLIFTGVFADSIPLSSNLFVMKTDLLANRKFFNSYDSLFTSQIEESTNGFVICGIESGPATYLAECDKAGQIMWIRKYDPGYPTFSECNSIVKTNDNGFVIAGSYHSGNYNYFMRIIKTDSFGKEVWRNLYGFNDHDRAFDIEQCKDTGYVLIGTRDNYQSGDVYVVKTDSKGYANPPVGVNSPNIGSNWSYDLLKNYPNPFNSRTKIEFWNDRAQPVRMSIIDSRGAMVKTLFNGMLDRGLLALIFDASELPSGIYFLNVTTRDKVRVISMALLK